jgi:hypothetical protein
MHRVRESRRSSGTPGGALNPSVAAGSGGPVVGVPCAKPRRGRSFCSVGSAQSVPWLYDPPTPFCDRRWWRLLDHASLRPLLSAHGSDQLECAEASA